MKEGKDVDRAEENAEALRQRIMELDGELQREIQALTAKWDVETLPLETIRIRPKKSHIATKLVTLAWVPYWVGPNGRQVPAWS